MLATVIPARRMPLTLPVLSYLVPEELEKTIKIGHLVEIPFRSKKEFGVVRKIETVSAAKERLKNIFSVIGDQPALAEAQIKFLEDLASLYHTSLGYVLKTNLPPLQKRKLSKLSFTTATANKKFDMDWKAALNIYNSEEDKKKYLLNAISKSGQTLILVPELADVPKMTDCLSKYKSELTVITGEISNKDLFERWVQIRNGVKRIVVGTRRALFLPWSDLRLIIMDDEGNANYKSWDMSPRFHARDAAKLLSIHHGASLRLTSHTPSVETLYNVRENKFDADKKSGWPEKLLPLPTVADMRDERRGGNYSFLSQELAETLKHSSGDIFLFLNKRGSFSYVGCRDCGYVFKCPDCRLALNYHQDSGELKCHYCSHAEKLAPACPKCHGLTLAMYGVGTQLAENAVRKFIGSDSNRQVIRVDRDTDNLDKLKMEGPKIIIGTQLAWPHLDWEKIKLMAFLDADSSLYIPEFKVTESVWQMLRDAQFRLPKDAEFIVQTNHPDHLVFASLFNPRKFYEQELQERSLLKYPPFSFLTRLLFANPRADVAEMEARKLREDLARLTQQDSCITISHPLETVPAIFGRQYWRVILIKIASDNSNEILKRLLAHVPPNWKVDPNPNTILSI